MYQWTCLVSYLGINWWCEPVDIIIIHVVIVDMDGGVSGLDLLGVMSWSASL